MISPTIGRVVLVNRPENTSGQPEPALICHVWSDTCINVGGFDSNGVPFAITSITLLQDDAPAPGTGSYAEWMPYQKGQAAKTEQAEAALKAVTEQA